MEKLYGFIGGRKLTFALVLTVLATVFVWFSKLSAEEWMDFMKWIYGTYAIGNVGEYVGKSLAQKKS